MWLMPAQRYRISSIGTPMSPASSSAVCCTLWHRPTVLIDVASLIAQQLIAIGFTYCRSIASAHSSSISWHTSSSTGTVRRARMMPPTPKVSAMVWRSPNRFGTSKSTTVDGS